MTEYHFHIDPMSAPTMTAADKYNKRPIVSRYFGYRNQIRCQANLKGLRDLPGCIDSLIFNIPMPGFWSKRKKNEMRGQNHTTRPDIDNILRGVMNVFGEDSHIHTIRNLQKIWSDTGSIVLITDNGEVQDMAETE